MRLSSFLLVCIGVQILWNGAKALLHHDHRPRPVSLRHEKHLALRESRQSWIVADALSARSLSNSSGNSASASDK